MSGLFARVQSGELAAPGPPGTLVEEGDYVGWYLYDGKMKSERSERPSIGLLAWILFTPILVGFLMLLAWMGLILLAILPFVAIWFVGNRMMINLGLDRFAWLMFSKMYISPDGRAVIPLTRRKHHVLRFEELDEMVCNEGSRSDFELHLDGKKYDASMQWTDELRAFIERHGVPVRYVHHDGGGDK